MVRMISRVLGVINDSSSSSEIPKAFSKRREKRFKELEQLIASGEKQLGELRAKLKSAPGDAWEELAKMAAEEQALARRVDTMMTEWAKLGEELA